MSLKQIPRFVHSLVDGRESCIVFAVMNILLPYLFVGMYFNFFGDKYGSGIVCSGRYMFNFVRNCQLIKVVLSFAFPGIGGTCNLLLTTSIWQR